MSVRESEGERERSIACALGRKAHGECVCVRKKKIECMCVRHEAVGGPNKLLVGLRGGGYSCQTKLAKRRFGLAGFIPISNSTGHQVQFGVTLTVSTH